MAGALALVGGGEFTEGCTFDAGLLEASGASEVLIVPTAAAYEHPQRLVERAVGWFDRLGVPAVGVDLLARPDASAPAVVGALAGSRFTYLVGGSPLHLRAVVRARRRGMRWSPPGRPAACWPVRRPAPWSCATRWSIPGAGRSPSASACSRAWRSSRRTTTGPRMPPTGPAR